MAKRGQAVLDLSMINPDLSPPRLMLDRLLESSTKSGSHRYGVARGVAKLREAFAEKYQTAFSTTLHPEEQICVTAGTKDGLFQLLEVLSAKFSLGAKALVGAPLYPAYRFALESSGIAFNCFDIVADEAVLLQNIIEKLEQCTPNILLLNFPNNPTGISVSADFYRALYRHVRGMEIVVINDFVYGEMCFKGKGISLLSIEDYKDFAVETYSLSKAYNVPGWRIGAVVGEAALIKSVQARKSRLDYGTFLPIQIASTAGLCADEDLVKPITDVYRRRLAIMAEGLTRCGFEVSQPTAGISLWTKLSDSYMSHFGNEQGFLLHLLKRCGILVMPGSVFGERFVDYIRLAAVQPEAKLREAVHKFSLVLPAEEQYCAAGTAQ